MRTASVLFVALIVLLNACKKDDDPTFTSAEGDWTYTTPDGAISVDFTIVKNGTDFEVNGKAMRVDNQDCKYVLQATNVTATNIGSVRINANDTKVTYAYFILFVDATVGDDFKEIKVPRATYTWPHDKTNELTDIIISRL
jgi:hypothetical protein